MELNAQTLWAILNSSSDGMLIVDKDCTVVAINDRYGEMFHETRANIVGKDFRDFKKNPLLLQVIRTGKPMIDLIYKSVVHEYRGKGLYISVFPILHEGEIIGAAATYRDIREPLESMQKFESMVRRYGNSLRSQHQTHITLDDIIGESPAILKSKKDILNIASNDSSVLLRGENGTGKDLFASALHNASRRASEPFVAINCPSLPENLAESELFGYVAGAFSGASREGKVGLFEIADNGTIFLDEIGDLSLNLQSKLLRVLENREFFRIGSVTPCHVNFRLISATNRNLEQMVADGMFREDLYFRLSVISIDIPPLRDRGNDILTLAEHFIRQESPEDKVLSHEVRQFFLDYEWPGNVRQLKNTITTMVNFSENQLLNIEHLPQSMQNLYKNRTIVFSSPAGVNEQEYFHHFHYPEDIDFSHLSNRQQKEARMLCKMLDEYGYSVSAKRRIAEKLDISLATLYNKFRQYGIGKK